MSCPYATAGNDLRRATALLLTLALIAACSKGAPEAAKPRASAEISPPAAANAPVLTPEANEALKERLARQEAATKLFDKARPEPPAAPKAAPIETTRPVAALPVVPKQEPAPVPAKSEPAPAPAKAAPVETPKPAPPQVAAAAPSPVPAAAAPAPASSAVAAAKLMSRADVEFPREAIQAGVDRGVVRARMTLDGNGNVTKVEVIEANPRRLFDRAVVRSLVNWRFNDGPSGRTVETEVEFKR